MKLKLKTPLNLKILLLIFSRRLRLLLCGEYVLVNCFISEPPSWCLRVGGQFIPEVIVHSVRISVLDIVVYSCLYTVANSNFAACVCTEAGNAHPCAHLIRSYFCNLISYIIVYYKNQWCSVYWVINTTWHKIQKALHMYIIKMHTYVTTRLRIAIAQDGTTAYIMTILMVRQIIILIIITVELVKYSKLFQLLV